MFHSFFNEYAFKVIAQIYSQVFVLSKGVNSRINVSVHMGCTCFSYAVNCLYRIKLTLA